MPKIVSQTKQVSELTATERATMMGLLSVEFLGVNHYDFTRDLEEKDAVVLLRKGHDDGEIVGFSTLVVLDLPIHGRNVKVVFSGDTTVLEGFRTSGGIGVGIGCYFLKTIDSFPQHEIYYVLISKGWRTYKVMPFFFNQFAPHPDEPVSAKDKVVMDAFGQMKYPKNYDPDQGLIMFSQETQRLKPGSIDAVPPPEPDAHTRYFLKKNPTYLAGTELVCVARVLTENFAAPLRRLIGLRKQRKE